MSWIADRQVQLVAAVAATLQGVVLLDVIELSGKQVAGLNAMVVAWLAVLVVPKKAAQQQAATAHDVGYDKALSDVTLMEPPPTPAKTAVKAVKKRRA